MKTSAASKEKVTKRLHSYQVYVLPVMPQTGWIDLQQIEDIVGPGNDRRIIKAALGHGFEALNVKFAKEISEILCSEPCYDPFTENTD